MEVITFVNHLQKQLTPKWEQLVCVADKDKTACVSADCTIENYETGVTLLWGGVGFFMHSIKL